MKIAVFHPTFSGNLGGTQKVSFETAAALSDEHEVYHYTEFENYERKVEDLGIDMRKDIIPESVKRAWYNKLLSLSNRFTLLESSLESRRWKRFIERKISEEGFDLVILTADFFGGALNSKSPVLTYHHGEENNLDELTDRKIYRKVLKLLRFTEVVESDYDLFNSHYTSEFYEADGEVIYPPVNSEYIFEEGDLSKIVYFARFSEEKNMEEAIEISEKSGSSLSLMGFKDSKSYLKNLKEISGEKVNFLPNATGEQVKSTLRNCGIGINTSNDYEGFGITTIEYMKSGCVTVVKDSAANSETVEMEDLKYNTVEEAVEIIKKLRTSDAFREKAIDYIKERKNDFSQEKFRGDMRNKISQIERDIREKRT
jgi:glycosyltransferase involved in cell wall biosynthesis